jgi:hypothetical protein
MHGRTKNDTFSTGRDCTRSESHRQQGNDRQGVTEPIDTSRDQGHLFVDALISIHRIRPTLGVLFAVTTGAVCEDGAVLSHHPFNMRAIVASNLTFHFGDWTPQCFSLELG